MDLVLALETTTDTCSVGLGNDESLSVISQHAPRQHSEILLSMVDRMVKSSGVARSDIECVAFSAGPGSFTGVRLGAAVAQGIAEAWGALVCPVPTAEAMARQVAAWQTELTEFHLARPSRQHLAYISTFNTKGGELACTESDRLLD
ncbi:MAG: tRNA (adenosine(37)-N6)-threonylcarbamoyltransferase complex dimerization subunit type 1 TsaB [Pseudomonadales bacterium]|nr:tRNA (adenosine(37)-N6)-threonylcarbamoyltransferase complex dimerization subunit type 1 TsaB [Pseudomonadales bacterium]